MHHETGTLMEELSSDRTPGVPGDTLGGGQGRCHGGSDFKSGTSKIRKNGACDDLRESIWGREGPELGTKLVALGTERRQL